MSAHIGKNGLKEGEELSEELRDIGKRMAELDWEKISEIDQLAYLLGDFSNGESTVAVCQDLLSFFCGWAGVARASREELAAFQQLEKRDIDIILNLRKLGELLQRMDN